jgi:hypothetical protein
LPEDPHYFRHSGIWTELPKPSMRACDDRDAHASFPRRNAFASDSATTRQGEQNKMCLTEIRAHEQFLIFLTEGSNRDVTIELHIRRH